MKLSPQFFIELNKYKSYVIIVEGKKDLSSLMALGFQKVYTLNKSGIPLRERVMHISQLINKKDKVCILTDFDKKGKALYLLLKSLFPEFGIKLDSSFRSILLKTQISHIEGLYHLMKEY